MPKLIKTPRCGIEIKNKVPDRHAFMASHIGSEKVMRDYMERVDTIAEHADALQTSNGISAETAVMQAINDIIKYSKEVYYSNGSDWKIRPNDRKSIVKYLSNI